jgi:NADPH:quinone reductase-like Zn-dependent oxidoreductase
VKAIVQDRYGAPTEVLQLREIDRPASSTGRVLLRVRAASVNSPGRRHVKAQPFLLRMGGGWARPKHPARGVDVAGVVDVIGSNVRRRFSGGRLDVFIAKRKDEDLAVLQGWAEAGRLVPVVDRVYSLTETAEVIRHASTSPARGKIIIRFGAS